MPRRSSIRPLPWQVTAILTLFFTAVAGAAAIGWWYARDSPPHQGPIVLIAVDGLAPTAFSEPPAGDPADAPAEPEPLDVLAALTADSVVFERAYSHSPLLLPAYASLVAGQLPFEHGVRDEGGFVLAPHVDTLAELLRSRGFTTGAAVSSPLLHPDAGVAQGFAFYDEASREPLVGVEPPVEIRGGVRPVGDTLDSAEAWARAQEDQRYFLFIQVQADDAAAAAERIGTLLRERGSYNRSTLIVVGHRGQGGASAALDEDSLRVPLLVKQPDQEGAGRRIADPVQHIDLVPTLLALVRAPVPRGLRGRSLKPLLTEDDGRLPPQPMYAESLAGYYRLGTAPVFALTVNELRYVRGATEALERLTLPGLDVADADTARGTGAEPPADPFDEASIRIDMAPLSATLDRLLASQEIASPTPVRAADAERLARAGYLQGLAIAVPPGADTVGLAHEDQLAAIQDHEAAARLLGEGNPAAAIRALQAIARTYPALPSVQYQIGRIAHSSGGTQSAIAALRAAAALRPHAPEVPVLLAAVLLRAERLGDASVQAARAVSLAAEHGPHVQAAAHEIAARVALARQDVDAALAEAAAVQAAVSGIPMQPFVQAVVAEQEGDLEAALVLLDEAAADVRRHGTALEGLHLRRAALLAAAERRDEAESAFREELVAFPASIAAYTGLATLYYGSARADEAAVIVEALLHRVPTRDGYAAAARTWSALGERARAERVRSEARARVRTVP